MLTILVSKEILVVIPEILITKPLLLTYDDTFYFSSLCFYRNSNYKHFTKQILRLGGGGIGSPPGPLGSYAYGRFLSFSLRWTILSHNCSTPLPVVSSRPPTWIASNSYLKIWIQVPQLTPSILRKPLLTIRGFKIKPDGELRWPCQSAHIHQTHPKFSRDISQAVIQVCTPSAVKIHGAVISTKNNGPSPTAVVLVTISSKSNITVLRIESVNSAAGVACL